MGRGPYDSAVEKMAHCICGIKARHKKDVILNAHELHEECPEVYFNTARRYIDSTLAPDYQKRLNEELLNFCKNTKIISVCDRYGIKVDDPDPQETSNPIRERTRALDQQLQEFRTAELEKVKNDFEEGLKRARGSSGNPGNASENIGFLQGKPVRTWLKSRRTLFLNEPIVASIDHGG